MPTYEYRCASCKRVSAIFARLAEKPSSVQCEHCQEGDAKPIVSLSSTHLSKLSKLERLDPKYDKMLDATAAKNPRADPDYYLKK